VLGISGFFLLLLSGSNAVGGERGERGEREDPVMGTWRDSEERKEVKEEGEDSLGRAWGAKETKAKGGRKGEKRGEGDEEEEGGEYLRLFSFFRLLPVILPVITGRFRANEKRQSKRLEQGGIKCQALFESLAFAAPL